MTTNEILHEFAINYRVESRGSRMQCIEAVKHELNLTDKSQSRLSAATKSAWESLQLPLLHDLDAAARSDNPSVYTPAMDAQDALRLLDRGLGRLQNANN